MSQAKNIKEAEFKSHLCIITYLNGLFFSGKPLKFRGGMQFFRLFCIFLPAARHLKLIQDMDGNSVATQNLADRLVTSLAVYELFYCQLQGLDTILLPQRLW